MSGGCALITGGTGFVGRHLVRHLASAGWQVHAVVRGTSDTTAFSAAENRLVCHTHSGAIDSMLAIMCDVRPQVVFHLASVSIADHRPAEVDSLITSNVLYGTQLVEAMTQAGVTALVNAGTSWQHYEKREYSPVNLYAATKQAFEALLQYYVEARNLRVITLKLFDTYGPHDRRQKLLNVLTHSAFTHTPVALSPGDQLIDIVHVDDVARSFLVAAKRLQYGEVHGHEQYAISSGQPISLRNLVKLFEQSLGLPIPIQWGGRPYRPREVMEPWCAASLPGWKPEVSLVEGLRRT